jgi:nucleotide-binding universal stress UspA family protein
MKNTNFKVLLYSDGSHQAFSAAVYTANLLKKMRNMHLTILQLREGSDEDYKIDYNWVDTWPLSPTSEWMNHVLSEYDSEITKEYHEILIKTNAILFESGYNVSHELLNILPGKSGTADTSHIENLIIDYALQNSFQLIVMGTRGLSTFKGLIFGSLAHNVLNKSSIPVLLVKRLPQEFIDKYMSEN